MTQYALSFTREGLVNQPGEGGSTSPAKGFMEEIEHQESSFVWDPAWNLVLFVVSTPGSGNSKS